MNTQAQAPAIKFAGNLGELVDACKADGLRVYVRPTDGLKHTYAYITDGIGIAYVQMDLLSPTITTAHKPCRECGTGFGLDIAPTAANVRLAMSMHAPEWATPSACAAVRKWESWDAFASSTHGKWSELIQY
jgi:hypothetical protein